MTKVESDPENQDLLNELADLLADNDRRDEAIELRVKLYELNPDYRNTLRLGRIEASDAQYELSNKYLIEALDKAPDDEEKKNVAMDISRNFQSLENLPNARRYARQASSIDPQWDQPYRQIAAIYAAAVSSCTQAQGRSIDREDRTVYWLVLDYLDRAKSVNPSQPSSFSRTYSQYEAVMPTTEDKFFNGWTKGESFRIDGSVNACYGWISESTTIR
jgi:tetratricopeptide (TPR) repeat protein